MSDVKFNIIETSDSHYCDDVVEPPTFLYLELPKIEGNKITQDECEAIIRTDTIEIVKPLNMGGKKFYVIFFNDKKMEGMIITSKQMESLKNAICEYKITLD